MKYQLLSDKSFIKQDKGLVGLNWFLSIASRSNLQLPGLAGLIILTAVWTWTVLRGRAAAWTAWLALSPHQSAQSKLSTSHYNRQTDRQTDRQTERQSPCFDLLCLTCPLNNGSLPHLSPLPPQSQGLTLLARPYREEIEFLSRRDNRSKLVAASLWGGPILTIIIQLLVSVLSVYN